MSAPIATDLLVIGAGPVGLFQAFQLGLQDIRCHIVDSLPHPGGQCTELYGDKPIYDIPGLPRCTGKELIERLQTQVRPFAPVFHGGHSVSSLAPQADGFAVATAKGLHFQAHSVVIAAGVGAFEPRRLAPEAFQALHGQQVFLRGKTRRFLQVCTAWWWAATRAPSKPPCSYATCPAPPRPPKWA